ncbi:DUF5992 family protein [Pseudoalteromonas denitrificans]|uniref:Uncharacterized protein n=1 Tax=Pseudoalteromonas denitrificans DSM 6059 TaxID=1123010 RepID=A0A1I1SGY3_9GAMM|nr:DUF5992 family protein [Pseudoalteromonas denitrificans]SFD42270.1 hypothetical protein SAMN02745724_04479 [Pseudoalteromonas denitrificans DSM 6059]
MKFFLVVFSSLISFSLMAGQLTSGAQVVELINTNNDTEDFAIFLKNGSGPCAIATPEGVYKIVFPKTSFANQSSESYGQAFSISLAAITSGLKVRVHNFDNNNCDQANFISIYSAS